MDAAWSQYVEQGTSDSIKVRLLDDDTQAEITISGTPTVVIYDSGGSELVASTNASGVSGSVATYTRTWTASTFSRKRGFRAVWTLSDGSNTYTRTTYFEVVRRIFRSQLDDSFFTDRYPYITNRLPSGLSDFSTFRGRAWMEIEQRLKKRIPEIRSEYVGRWGEGGRQQLVTFADSSYPGNLFNPEEFLLCHELLTLSGFYEAISFDGSALSDEENKSQRLRERAWEQFDIASSQVAFDLDDDGLIDNNERQLNLSTTRITR